MVLQMKTLANVMEFILDGETLFADDVVAFIKNTGRNDLLKAIRDYQDGIRRCKRCEGEGTSTVRLHSNSIEVPCIDCDGTGWGEYD